MVTNNGLYLTNGQCIDDFILVTKRKTIAQLTQFESSDITLSPLIDLQLMVFPRIMIV